MKKCAKINLCIIGSTNFGKSSIAASLIHVAATTDGGIHLLGSPTQVLKMADDLKANGQHVATGWDDIAKFKFLLNGSDGRSWQISLRDYPGALFAKYVEHPTLMSRVKGLFAGQTTSSHDEYTFDKTAEKKAIQLIAELERADALIVLVPADVSDAKYGNDRAIYKQKLPEFIEAVMRHRPNIPVCLCINKWDMFDCGIEKLEDKIKEYPFCDFYQSLQHVCGDNLSIAAVSAFGHHDPNDREKIDPNQEQKPLNILETLLPLAEKAEKARFERTVDAWKQSNWIKKTLVFPFRTASLLAARYTDKHIRNGLLKMAAKAWSLFSVFVLSVAAVLLIATTLMWSAKEVVGFRILERSLDDYKANPYLVKVQDLDAARRNLEYSNIIRKTLFQSRVNTLKARLDAIEEDYNNGIVGDAKNYCGKEENKDIAPSEKGDPEERKKRAARRKGKLDELREKLTVRARSQENELKKLIKSEDELLQNIENNYPLYREAYELFHDSDRKNVCRRIRRFVDAQKGAHPERQTLFAELEGCLDKTEKSIAEELERKTTECKNSNPPKTAAEQAELDRKLIDLITAYESQFVENSENFKPFAKMRENLIADEGDQNKYGPFDTEYNRLAALDRTGKLREIKKFKDKYSYDKFPKRKKKFDALDNLSRELLDYIAGEVKKAETDNRDNDKLFAQQRIDLATALKNKYKWAAGEYIQDSDEQREVLRKKSKTKRLIADLEKYKAFDEEYSNSKLDQNNLRAVAAFLSTFTVNAYSRPEYVGKIKALELVRDARIKEIDERLKAELKDDNKSIAASERIKLCQECINALNRALKKYVEGSKEFHDTEMRLEAQKVFLETLRSYEKFEIEVSALLGSDENGKLRRIAEFLQNHPKDRYKDVYHQKLFDRLKEMQKTLLEHIKANLDVALEQNREDLTLSPEKIVARATGRKAAYEKAMEQYVEKSTPWEDANRDARAAEAQRAEWEPYIKLEEDYLAVKNASECKRLERIENFFKNYRDRKLYSKRANYFTDLETLKQITITALDKKRASELDIEPPKKTDFAACIRYYERRGEILKRYLQCYPQAYDQYKEIQDDLVSTGTKKAKYEHWRELEILVVNIESARKTSKDDPRILMPMIQPLEENFPQDKNPEPELNGLYARVKPIKERAEVALVDELERALKKYPDEGEGKELQDNLKGRMKTINEFLRYLKGTKSYKTYNSLYREYNARLDEESQRAFISSAIAELRRKLDSSLAPKEKYEEIDRFMARHTDCQKYFPLEFGDLALKRKRLYRIALWYDLKEKIRHHLDKGLPDDSEPTQLRDYKSECESFRKQLGEYPDVFIKSDVGSIRRELDDRIKLIEKRIGDGTYADIEEKEKIYKVAPTKENHDRLKWAFDEFDPQKPENNGHKDKVETIRERSEQDWTARQKIMKAWENLKNRPNSKNLHEFTTCCMDSRLWTNDQYHPSKIYAKPEELEVYKNYLDIISHDEVFVELTGLDHLSKLGSVAGDLHVKLVRENSDGKQKTLLDFKFEHYYWYRGQDKVTDHIDGKFKNRVSGFQNQKFIIASIGNWQYNSGLGDHVDIPVDPIEILVRLAAGESIIQKDYKCLRGVLVRLVFSRE